MGRRSRRRIARIMGEEAGAAAERPVQKDRTKLYLGIGIAGIVVVLGIAFIITNTLAHSGSDSGTVAAGAGQNNVQSPGSAADAQVVRITVTAKGYQPSQPTVQAGKPIRLIVDGSQAPGCYSYIMSQSLGFSKQLGSTPEVIDIPALQPGKYGFSCGMGMIRGSLNVQ